MTARAFCRAAMTMTLAVASLTIAGCSDDEAGFDGHGPRRFPADRIIDPASEYVVVFGDIQEYTDDGNAFPYFTASVDWIKCQDEIFGNISCVLQVGDVTWRNKRAQWASAVNAFKRLDERVLYLWCTGNHDYDCLENTFLTITDRHSSKSDSYISNHRLDDAAKTLFAEGSHENLILHDFVTDHEGLDLICLEFGARPEVVEWAADYVVAHPSRRFILMTHEWLTRDGERVDEGSYAEMQFGTLPHSTPEQIWRRLVYPNDNVIAVLCGHNGFCSMLKTPNSAGRDVTQVLFNLQYQRNGGDSMVQLWRFDPQSDKIDIFVYNILTGEVVGEPGASATIAY